MGPRSSMFSSVSRLALAAWVSFLVLHSVYAGSTGKIEAVAATGFVEQYFEALRQGDTAAVLDMLGPELRERYKSALSNPKYAEHLRSIYQGAELYDVAYGDQPLGAVVTASLRFPDGELRRIQFRLERRSVQDDSAGLAIVSEQELP